MRTYVIVSAVVFDFITAVQLVRLFLGWPVQVAGFSVPVWASGIAALIVGSLAVWGMRLVFQARAATPAA